MAKQDGTLKDYLKMARFDHWIKQLFIVPGIVFAFVLVGEIDIPVFIKSVVLGFLSTCFIASANYIINEWLDAEFDQFHPTKKSRIAVTSKLKGKYIYILYALFAVVGLVLGFLTSTYVFACELWLLIMGVVYNVKPVRSKDIPYVDVLSESVNNAIRLLIGWFIVTSEYLPPITIVLGYWMLGAFLMAIKRYAEYRMIDNSETAGLYRKSFKGYSEQSLLISAVFYALCAVFCCGIFMIKYKIELLLAIPMLCGLFCYYLHISYKKDSAVKKPEKLFKERGLVLYIAVFIVLVCVLMLIQIPALNGLLETTLIEAV